MRWWICWKELTCREKRESRKPKNRGTRKVERGWQTRFKRRGRGSRWSPYTWKLVSTRGPTTIGSNGDYHPTKACVWPLVLPHFAIPGWTMHGLTERTLRTTGVRFVRKSTIQRLEIPFLGLWIAKRITECISVEDWNQTLGDFGGDETFGDVDGMWRTILSGWDIWGRLPVWNMCGNVEVEYMRNVRYMYTGMYM